jgi:hypothetical protein
VKEEGRPDDVGQELEVKMEEHFPSENGKTRSVFLEEDEEKEEADGVDHGIP